ncbi:MAG: hypothetical protein BAJALOKI1v1_710004 [Promethearchaeota archaeon]|nr:MAG: hypothetical protein BAJALOKI1v1_710004 [Candidatus Lokiarchaeota archaeon]
MDEKIEPHKENPIKRAMNINCSYKREDSIYDLYILYMIT